MSPWFSRPCHAHIRIDSPRRACHDSSSHSLLSHNRQHTQLTPFLTATPTPSPTSMMRVVVTTVEKQTLLTSTGATALLILTLSSMLPKLVCVCVCVCVGAHLLLLAPSLCPLWSHPHVSPLMECTFVDIFSSTLLKTLLSSSFCWALLTLSNRFLPMFSASQRMHSESSSNLGPFTLPWHLSESTSYLAGLTSGACSHRPRLNLWPHP